MIIIDIEKSTRKLAKRIAEQKNFLDAQRFKL